MNKHKFLILSLSVALFAVSCKKMDQQNAVANQAPATNSATVKTAATVEWKTVDKWSSSKQEKFTVYNGNLKDSSITSAVVEKGLVLVYKNGNAINQLPYQEKGTNDVYWYYQVSVNTIQIIADAYSSNQNLGNNETFKYFILSAEHLKDLETKGHSKIELLTLSYENAATLLK